MSNEDTQFDDIYPATSHHFSVGRFCVEGELLGRAHKFRYSNKKVKITLPTKAAIYRSEDDWDLRVGMLSGHRQGPRGGLIDPQYDIFEVRVLIEMTEMFTVPHVLPPKMNPYKSLSASEQKRLQNAVSTYGSIANHAFRFWLRVLRWQTGVGLLGREIAEDFEGRHGANTIDPRTGRSFGFGYHHLTASIGRPITRAEWKSTAKFLTKGSEPPPWTHWLFEGQFAEVNGNYQGATAYYAISCESFVLGRFIGELSQVLNQDKLDIIERQITIRNLLERYAKRQFSHMRKKDWTEIHKLFDVRNPIVHSGVSPHMTADNCKRFRLAVHKLIYGGLMP